MDGGRRDRLPGRPPSLRTLAAVGLGLAAGLTAVLLTWFWRGDPAFVLSGWFQGDMPTYVCYGRMTLESATTLTYASPHDIRPEPAAWLVNLPITVTGWLLAAGVPGGWAGHALRLLFAPPMYAALGLLLRSIFRPGRWFWAAFLIVGVGGGFAWLGALVEVDLAAEHWPRAWRAAVKDLESPYYWWFLDVFRNLTYPLELAYHAIVLAQLWALGNRRHGLSVVCFALACLSNPFVGIQAAGVECTTLALAWVRRRPRPSVRVTAAALAVAAAFVGYYAVLLPMDPAIRSLQEQHQHDLADPMTLESLLVGYGPALLAPLTLLDPSFRRWTWRRFAPVPLFVLAAWTAVLTQNTRFLEPDQSLMPMHFSRGWLQVALWPILLAWLQHRARHRVLRRPLEALALALVVATLPDNALFVEDMYAVAPHRSSLRWDRNYEEVHALLREGPDRRVLVDSWMLGRQICGLYERHRSAIGTHLTTPGYAERQAEIRAFRRDPTREGPMLRWADLMVVGAEDHGWVRAAEASGRWEEVLCNPRWCVYERVPPAASPPGNSGD
ncbi:MAG TPA: hypothetical protein RMH99_29470 [Sandaracinaceae bacterium LLY-WYZ-13_1]|nr:hypothetical protein [Sandaracinaceae bacterium LLY-WYZ-13_1]